MDADALDKLKDKVIQEYNKLLCKVKKGYKLDYEYILEEITFIDIVNELDLDKSLTTLLYYLNNKWLVQY